MRHIAVVTTSRADYSHLYWVLRELCQPQVRLSLLVGAAHLAEDFGLTERELAGDGFDVAATFPCLSPRDDDVGMAATIGEAGTRLAATLGELRPDLLLLIADRYEMLAPAAVATALRIPIAHIEGGEVSQGAIDDTIRNALTKLAHVHFTATALGRRRVIGMGEEPWRVHHTGAPSLDHLRRSRLPDRTALAARLGVPVAEDGIVVAYHPVTLARDTLLEADAVFDVLARCPHPLYVCHPNADAGGRSLARRVRALAAARPDVHVFVNLNPILFWALLRSAAAMFGNSSSGIMEAPALALPVVNVGRRQQGRERAANVIDAPADVISMEAALDRALQPGFRASLHGLVNPYGDGDAARRIAQVLLAVPLGETLLVKAPVPPAD